MKSIKIFVVLLFLFPPVFAFSQSKIDTAKINFIKAQFSDINLHIKSLRKITRDDSEQTTDGGEVTGYFSDNEIKKITTIYYGETFKASEEYYFFNKKLIFYYSLEEHYTKPYYIDPKKIDVASKNKDRYYFNNESIIKYINKPFKKIRLNDLNKASRDVQAEVKRLRSVLKH